MPQHPPLSSRTTHTHPTFTGHREFIERLREVTYKLLQRGPKSRAKVLGMLTELGVVQVALTPGDIQDILDTLVYDGFVETMPSLAAGPAVPAGLASARASAEGSAGPALPLAVSAGAGADSVADRTVYRVCKQPAHYNHMSSVPCGSCPVRQHCHPGGTISPEKCVYMDAWLYEF